MFSSVPCGASPRPGPNPPARSSWEPGRPRPAPATSPAQPLWDLADPVDEIRSLLPFAAPARPHQPGALPGRTARGRPGQSATHTAPLLRDSARRRGSHPWASRWHRSKGAPVGAHGDQTDHAMPPPSARCTQVRLRTQA
ncbi:hypothetical protein NDU88_006862 [Pleurodeles waltl]|uniref:Uncharacterized protein n=1 Tax=Pleurodeles waltl TaxID=8319 RepID=A0AAV7X412_PLEWA|nr:hypothetical protein NDU88_006862 [Pleurodeles waltl]